MANIIGQRSTHAGKLERYLGKEEVERISSSMTSWYGTHPILVSSVPSVRGIHVGRGGDFVGTIDGGGFASLLDRCVERADQALTRVARRTSGRMSMAGFSSLSDLINEATIGGKKSDLFFLKAGTAGVINATSSLWRVGNQPAAGNAASNAPAGNVPTNATTGALPSWNPSTVGDTQHFVRADMLASTAGTLLLYDRIFEVNKTMSSATAENVTGTPTRYQATTNTPDSADGNFLFFEGQAALGATAHTWSASYLDHDGNAATIPTLTGNASNIINRLDHPIGQWFAPLASGDVGIKALTQVTCSAVVTGTLAVVIGHPIAFLPIPITNLVTVLDGINTAFNLARIFDNAALGFLEVTRASAAAATYTGSVSTVAG